MAVEKESRRRYKFRDRRTACDFSDVINDQPILGCLAESPKRLEWLRVSGPEHTVH
jgi:hypothetical protein